MEAWEHSFLGTWENEHRTNYLPRSLSKDSYDFYNLAYGIDATTAMYRATGRRMYLDRALLYASNLMASARASHLLAGSQFKDGYLGWGSKRDGAGGQEVPLYESYCWRYVTRLLRVIRETPELYADPTYRARYEKLLAFTEKNIFEKWYVRGARVFIYRDRTHMASHWAFIAMDLSLITEDDSARSMYRSVVDTINQRLRAQLKPNTANPEAFFWNATWGSYARPGQDVPHGNGVLAFIVEAHDAGIAWTDDDLRRFITMLDSVIWRSEGQYAAYVDGSGKGGGWFNDGMMKLGRYDARLQRRLEQHTVGENTQFFANGALNARLLAERLEL